jgi:hypothetical protein
MELESEGGRGRKEEERRRNMKTLKTKVMVLAALVVAAGVASGASVRTLTVQERALWGADTAVTITHADLTTTNVNTAQTLTNVLDVSANHYWQCVAMQLTTAFTVGTTNYTDALGLTVGDGTSASLFLDSTELASDGTEVFLKAGRKHEGALSQTTMTVVTNCPLTATQSVTYVTGFTPTFAAFDGTNVVIGITTNTATMVVTNATTALTGTGLASSTLATTLYGSKQYTAADTIDFTFTPDANQAVSQFTAGEVIIYFRHWKP